MKNNITNITPSERLTRLSDIENAKWLIDSIVAECGGEMWAVDGLILLLEAVVRKGDTSATLDYADDLQAHLFNQTVEHSKRFVDYKEAIAKGRKYGFWDEEDEESQQPAVLDLSACQPEQLNTRISELTDTTALACAISGVLNNPKLPVEIHNTLTKTFSVIFNNSDDESDLRKFETSPEYISLVLKNAEGAE